ncbi:MAG: hypothetical protein ACKN9A_21120, partial [Microcystis aeruginosa]
MTPQAIPKLNHLPSALAREGAVCLELEDGVAIFRASTAVQTRIEELLQLEKESAITPAQKQELDAYEEIETRQQPIKITYGYSRDRRPDLKQ